MLTRDEVLAGLERLAGGIERTTTALSDVASKLRNLQKNLKIDLPKIDIDANSNRDRLKEARLIRQGRSIIDAGTGEVKIFVSFFLLRADKAEGHLKELRQGTSKMAVALAKGGPLDDIIDKTIEEVTILRTAAYYLTLCGVIPEYLANAAREAIEKERLWEDIGGL